MSAEKLWLLESAPDPADAEPVCEDAPYPHYPTGKYEARCVAKKIYLDPRFKRHVCQLQSDLLSLEDGKACPVFSFLNLGSGETPRAVRGSEYRRAWIIANGDPPRKRQTMSARVFVGKIFIVRVADVIRRHDGREHPDGEVYSTVKEILKRTWP